jgi:predicted signal transduction protein with EAL and GGDEF domain
MHTFHFSNKSASNTITSLEKILNSSDEIDSQTGYPNHNKMLLCGNTLLTYLNETHTKGAFAAIEILNVQKSGLYCGGASQSKNTWKRILDIVSECLPKNAYLGRVTLGIAIHVWGDEIEKKFERILKRITLTLESLEVESVVTKENVPLYISSHIGYLIYPDDCGIQEDTYYNITRFVALSAYTYKSVEIASSIQRYEKKLSEQLIQKIQIESKLFPSILNGDFKFFFQPQLNLKTNKIVGAEMLCRWEDAGLEKEKTMEYI